jgi:hypothetical protein
MLVTTTPGIEGRPVTGYLGIVTAQGVLEGDDRGFACASAAGIWPLAVRDGWTGARNPARSGQKTSLSRTDWGITVRVGFEPRL